MMPTAIFGTYIKQYEECFPQCLRTKTLLMNVAFLASCNDSGKRF